jgi:EF hand domain-containing protein
MMKAFSAVIPLSALALALAAGSATAGDKDKHGSSPLAQFESLDRNSDQRLSQDEASDDESVSGKFAALDVDGDGYVTKREFTARMKKDRDESSRDPS